MCDEQKSKVVHKEKRSKLELLRGNLPRDCQASCLRSLHLQMVACQVIIIKMSKFCNILLWHFKLYGQDDLISGLSPQRIGDRFVSQCSS